MLALLRPPTRALDQSSTLGGCILALLLCSMGCYPSESDVEEPTPGEVERSQSAIYQGVVVGPSIVLMTGAVSIQAGGGGGCSGTLVTPYWILTAAHCGVGQNNTVSMGTLGARTAGSAIPHPQFDPNATECGGRFDAALVRLATPIFPRLSDGRTWEGFRRDLYRGVMTDLPGAIVDVYGYGATQSDPGGNNGVFGTLKYANNTVEAVDAFAVQFDSSGGANGGEVRIGDSGAGVLAPGAGVPGWNGSAAIAAIVVEHCTTYPFPNETNYFGTRSDLILAWFDATVGPDWGRFDYPSRVFASTARIGILQ